MHFGPVFFRQYFFSISFFISLSRERTLEEEEEAVSLDDAFVKDERG